MTRVERVAVRMAVFLGGAMLMALEVSAFRMIGKTFGSALRETTAVIAVFLAAMSIGYWAGGMAGDRWPRPSAIVAALLGAAASLLYVPWLDAVISPRIAASAVDMSVHAFMATAVLFAVPTFLFSSISPIAVRLFATTTTESGETAGAISAISTIGSIAGSIITAFFLIDWLASIARTVIFVSLAACATAAGVAMASMPGARGRPRSFSPRAGLALAVASALILITTAVALRRSSLEYSLIGSSHQQVLFVGDSAYHRIVVLQRLRTRRELMFDTAAQTRMDTRDPFGPGNPYTDSFHLARLMRPGIKRVLMIGLGGGTAAKQFVRYYPDVTFDVVEVDPMVVHVAQQFFGVQPGGRLRIHLGDGRTFVQRSAERWDLIIIDAYTEGRYGVTIPPHLATREFFNDVASHLTEGGILHFHCVFTNSPLLPAIEKTIANVFPSTLVAKGEIIGSMVPLITPREVMTQRAGRGPTARLPELTSYIALLGPLPPIPARIPLLTDDYAPVDTLIHAPH